MTTQPHGIRQQVKKSVIIGLLILQMSLIGIQTHNRIKQGDSVIETLIWMLNQCFPVLRRADSLEDRSKKRDNKDDRE